MMDRATWIQAGNRLAAWSKVMVLSHQRPDGDALGAMVAIKRFVESADGQASAFIYEEAQARYAFLPEKNGFEQWPDKGVAELDAAFDGVVIVDTCSWSQLGPAADFLRASTLPRIIVDHHETRDDIAGNGSIVGELIDPSAASACGMICAWCRLMGWPVDAATAEALFTGIATDTGWFRFSNTDGRTLASAGWLLDHGLHPDKLYAAIYENRSPARLRLLAEVLSTLQFHADGAIACMWITPEMFEWSKAVPADTEEIVNEPMVTRGVIVSILLTDQGDGELRINLRSKSPESCGVDVDVSALASSFGGGGHQRAAGARTDGPLEQVRDQVISAAIDLLRQAQGG